MAGTSICPVCGTPVPDEYASEHYATCKEPTMRERVSRERREAVKAAIEQADPVSINTPSARYRYYGLLADAALQAALPDREAFIEAVDELVDVIKGFEPDSTIEDKKIALRDLVYGDDDASGGTR